MHKHMAMKFMMINLNMWTNVIWYYIDSPNGQFYVYGIIIDLLFWLQGGGSEVENSAVQPQMEPVTPNTEVEQNFRDHESKDQQYFPRRSYQNYRGGRGGNGGGRRGGYPNGRGGRGSGRGGYQNGRSQFYDQPGNYYPRNNHFRGRGGRVFSGNFGYHAGQAAHVQTES